MYITTMTHSRGIEPQFGLTQLHTANSSNITGNSRMYQYAKLGGTEGVATLFGYYCALHR